MMCLSGFRITKFLPDCKIKTIELYIPNYLKLLNSVARDCFQFNSVLGENIDFAISANIGPEIKAGTETKQLFSCKIKNFGDLLQSQEIIFDHYASMLCQSKIYSSIDICYYDDYTSYDEEEMFSMEIKINLTKIPHINVFLQVPDAFEQEDQQFFNKIESKILEGLNIGFWDIYSSTSAEFTIHGRIQWLYLKTKIEGKRSLFYAMKIEEISRDESSLIYNFSENVKNLLLKNHFPIIKTIEVPLDYELSDMLLIQYRKLTKEFLKECDQALLEAWSKQEFRQKLASLRISPKKWLKIGYSYKLEYLWKFIVLLGRTVEWISELRSRRSL